MIRPNFDPADEPRTINDLTYDELVAMIEAICDPNTDEEISGYYVGLIDCTLPGANVSDLIFCPDEWFRDKAKLNIDLSPIDVANYILAWTERRLLGDETIVLPTIPDSKRAGPPSVIEL